MVTFVLLLMAFIIILVMLVQRIQMHKAIKRITQTTKVIQKGNINMRYRVPTTQNEIQNLGGELNRMMDYFQNIFGRTAFLEEERKQMIANISHDLRTPLTSLLGYMEALQNDRDLTIQEKEEFLAIAVTKGDSLMKLLQDFFELARLEANDSRPEIEKINLTDIIQETLVSFYPQFEKISITPAIEIPDKPLFVLGDKEYIKRICNNLLSNALRYGTDGNEIGVKVRNENNFVWVEVWDKGKGISENDLPKIFDRLYTGQVSRSTTLQGTGLGLTITKDLVGQLGGTIKASSIPYQKTSFTFSLRLYK